MPCTVICHKGDYVANRSCILIILQDKSRHQKLKYFSHLLIRMPLAKSFIPNIGQRIRNALKWFANWGLLNFRSDQGAPNYYLHDESL